MAVCRKLQRGVSKSRYRPRNYFIKEAVGSHVRYDRDRGITAEVNVHSSPPCPRVCIAVDARTHARNTRARIFLVYLDV